jgi:hypothetical protein
MVFCENTNGEVDTGVFIKERGRLADIFHFLFKIFEVMNKKRCQAVNGDGRPNAPPVNQRKNSI